MNEATGPITKTPVVLNHDERQDNTPVVLTRPSWVPQRGPIGSNTVNPATTTPNVGATVPVEAEVSTPAASEPVEATVTPEPTPSPVVAIPADVEGGTTSEAVIVVTAPAPAGPAPK